MRKAQEEERFRQAHIQMIKEEKERQKRMLIEKKKAELETLRKKMERANEIKTRRLNAIEEIEATKEKLNQRKIENIKLYVGKLKVSFEDFKTNELMLKQKTHLKVQKEKERATNKREEREQAVKTRALAEKQAKIEERKRKQEELKAQVKK